MNPPGRYHLVCAVFKTMLKSYCDEDCGLLYVNTHLHIQSLSLTFNILCVKFSFVAFPSRIILISGLLSPESNQSTASPLVTVKKTSNKQHQIQRYRFIPIIRFARHQTTWARQLSSSCIRSNAVGSSFRLLHSFVNWFKVQDNFTRSCFIRNTNFRIIFSLFLLSKWN